MVGVVHEPTAEPEPDACPDPQRLEAIDYTAEHMPGRDRARTAVVIMGIAKDVRFPTHPPHRTQPREIEPDMEIGVAGPIV